MQWSMIAAVAAGGAVGSVLRSLTMSRVAAWAGTGFPWGTLAVNVAGSLVMGILVELMALAWSPAAATRAFLTVGVLGGFTTFSTFSLDVAVLMERQALAAAGAYVAASVLLSVAALFLGMQAVRTALS